MVTAEKREWLAGRWEHQWRRRPAAGQLGRLVEDFVREEALYREALARGLDLADLVVRHRLVQKMELLAFQDSAPLGDAGVMDYFLAHREGYRLPERSRSPTPVSAPRPAVCGPQRTPARRGPGSSARRRPGPPGWVTRRWLRAR